MDVRLFNASTLGSAGIQCHTWTGMGGNASNDKTNGLCFADNYVTPDPKMTYGNAEYDEYLTKHTIDPCMLGTTEYCTPDRWVGSIKACEDAGGRPPTMAELTTIANSMYHTNVGALQDIGMGQALYEDPYSLKNVYLWSSDVHSSVKQLASLRAFHSDYSYYHNYTRDNTILRARCVSGS